MPDSEVLLDLLATIKYLVASLEVCRRVKKTFKLTFGGSWDAGLAQRLRFYERALSVLKNSGGNPPTWQPPTAQPPQQSKKVPCGGRECNPNECCSKYDWCGTSSGHCGDGCKGGACWKTWAAQDTDSAVETPDQTESVTKSDNAVISENAETSDDTESQTGDSFPAWAVGLVVLGAISAFLIVVVLIVVVKKSSAAERV